MKVYNPPRSLVVNTPLNVLLGLSNHENLPVHRAGTHRLHSACDVVTHRLISSQDRHHELLADVWIAGISGAGALFLN